MVRKVFLLFFSVLTFFTLSCLVQAAIYKASNESEWDTAYANASNGDTIQVVASWVSSKQYNIAKSIVIQGVGNPIITLGADVSYQFYLMTNGVTIKDFSLNGDKTNRTDGSGIGCASSTNNQTISGMVIADFKNFGIACESDSSGINITGCTIKTCDSSSYGLIYLYNSNGDTIYNCTFIGDSSCQCGQHGVYADNSLNGTISNCSFADIAIDVIHLTSGSDSWLISKNHISNWALSADGNAFYIFGDDCSIINNVINQNTDTGYRATVFYDYGNSTKIQSNTVRGKYLYIILRTAGHPVTFKYNNCDLPNADGTVASRVYTTDSDGSLFAYNLWRVKINDADEKVYKFKSEATGARTVKVYNDTIINSSSNGTAILFNEGTSGTWDNVEVKNCIIKGFDKGILIDDRDNDGVNIDHKNNDYYDNSANIQKNVSGTFTDIPLDSTEINQNPLLYSTCRLTTNSPCIDAGVKLPIHDKSWKDLAGNRIRYGTAPDIGCYEAKTWPLGAWGVLPWIGGKYKVQWAPYGE